MYVRYVVMFMKVMRLPQSAPSVTLPLPSSPSRRKARPGLLSM